MRFLRYFAILAVAMLVAGCAAQRHRDTVAAGLLIQGTPQRAFLDVWGPPDKTGTKISTSEETRAEFNRFGGFYGRKNVTYEVWEYQQRGVELLFERQVLAAWHTEKTTEQLRSK